MMCRQVSYKVSNMTEGFYIPFLIQTCRETLHLCKAVGVSFFLHSSLSQCTRSSSTRR